MHTIKYCPICKKDLPNPYFTPEFFICCSSPDDHESQFVDTGLLYEEAIIIRDISEDVSFLEAMIDLKQKDPIEFQLKMSQFKATQPQIKAAEESSSVPKCPTCNSINVQKIGGLERVGSVAIFGLFSKKINKSFKCGNCGHTW